MYQTQEEQTVIEHLQVGEDTIVNLPNCIKGMIVCLLLIYIAVLAVNIKFMEGRRSELMAEKRKVIDRYTSLLNQFSSTYSDQSEVAPDLDETHVKADSKIISKLIEKLWEECIFSSSKMHQKKEEIDQLEQRTEHSIHGHNEASIRPVPLDIESTVKYGKSKPKLRTMKLVIVENKDANNAICTVSNSITILNEMTLQTINNFLDAGVRKGIFIVDAEEHLSDTDLQSSLKDYKVRQINVTVDSDYLFIRGTVKQCEKVVYVQNHFQIAKDAAAKLVERAAKGEPLTLFYSSSAYTGQGSDLTLKILKDLNQTDLENGVHPQEINEYVFGFDARFLDIITPLNFAFFNRYTVEELLIYPILALLQGSSRLQKYEQAVHSLPNSYVQFVEFEVTQTNNEERSMCFLSFPNDPFKHSPSDLSEYLSTLKNPNKQLNASLIVYAPYSFNSSTEGGLWWTCKHLFNFTQFQNVRLRIRANKTVVSLGAYESAHTYCPLHSIMVSSRQNIRFSPEFLSVVRRNINEKNHYYFFNFENESQQKVTFLKIPFSPKWRQQAILTTSHLGPLQVYKSDLMRMLYLWVLKCEEIDFYESQAAITMPMMELISGNIGFPPETESSIFTVEARNRTNKELRDIENLKLYYVWWPERTLVPRRFNSLSNLSFRRFARDKIPRRIHQIWIGQLKISPFKIALAQTLKEHNPNYEYRLWRFQDITQTNFPYTHSLVIRFLHYQELTKYFLLAAAVDLLRYEVIYRQGGFYMDFKIEGRKSLDSFLKYEIMFTDPDYYLTHGSQMKFVGNTVLGGVKGNHHFNNVLTGILTVETVVIYFPEMTNRITGGYRVRRAFNNEELYTVSGFLMHLGSQYTEGTRLYEEQTNFTADQQIFTAKSSITKQDFKVGLPCTVYQEAYLIYYMGLGASWIVPKDQFIQTQMRL